MEKFCHKDYPPENLNYGNKFIDLRSVVKYKIFERDLEIFKRKFQKKWPKWLKKHKLSSKL